MGSSSNGYSVFLLLFAVVVATASASNFYQDFDLTWGDNRAKIFNGGQLLSLSLDKTSGSGFQSKKEYLFGRIDMQLKLVAGNSAGTVTAYYVCHHSQTSFLFYFDIITKLYFVRDDSAFLMFTKDESCLNICLRKR